MRQRRRLGLALTSAAAGVAFLAIASPALADPAGNNGTVKIDTVDVDNVNDNNHANHPHVPCDFQLRFFDFDLHQTAKITFAIQPPSGKEAVLFSETREISDDAAMGGQDEDAVIPYSGEKWGLESYIEHPQQGYHVKLTIESDGVPGGVKHKVFWLQGCESNETTSPTPPTTPGSPPPSSPEVPTSSSPGAPGEGGGLPLTGAGAAGMAALGIGLVGGGAALVIARRRRDNITFTS